MISQHEAHKALIQNHYSVWMQSPYQVPVIVGAKFNDVADFLHSQGYEGEFIVINEKKAAKAKHVK